MKRATFRDRVAQYFRSRPNVWIDAVALEFVGGRQAWRTRVSDCRTELHMDIRNRQEHRTSDQGEPYTVSFYMFVPAEEAIAAPHDLNQWGLQ